MNSVNAALQALLCRECDERMQCAEALLRARPGTLAAADYDRLYQEFDSLYGGARATNLPESELLFFTLARYVRFLKRLEPPPANHWQISAIAEGIGLARQCKDGDGAGCSSGQVKTFIEKLNAEMLKAEADHD